MNTGIAFMNSGIGIVNARRVGASTRVSRPITDFPSTKTGEPLPTRGTISRYVRHRKANLHSAAGIGRGSGYIAYKAIAEDRGPPRFWEKAGRHF